MRKNYRSTHGFLSRPTARLVGRLFEQSADDARNETLLPWRSALHGDGPETFSGASQDAEPDALAARVRGWLDSGSAPGKTGVSARSKKTATEPGSS